MNRHAFRAAYRTARALFRLEDRFGVRCLAVFQVPAPAFYAATARLAAKGRGDPLNTRLRFARDEGINRVTGQPRTHRMPIQSTTGARHA